MVVNFSYFCPSIREYRLFCNFSAMIDPNYTVSKLNGMNENTMMEHLGIEFTDIGSEYITAKMPVDHRTHQPYGLLHGGASVALAETLGSVAAHCSIDIKKYYPVGLEINANHIRSVKDGFVYGKAVPVHIGKQTQVWEIRITDQENKLVSISRITIAILNKR